MDVVTCRVSPWNESSVHLSKASTSTKFQPCMSWHIFCQGTSTHKSPRNRWSANPFREKNWINSSASPVLVSICSSSRGGGNGFCAAQPRTGWKSGLGLEKFRLMGMQLELNYILKYDGYGSCSILDCVMHGWFPQNTPPPVHLESFHGQPRNAPSKVGCIGPDANRRKPMLAPTQYSHS